MNKLQFRVLYRQFLLRIIDLDLIAPQGDVSKLLGQFAALLLLIGLWVFPLAEGAADMPLPPEMKMVMVWAIAHFLISTTMLVVGLFAVLSWESMFPDRRDVLVLSPLPVPSRTLFLAKMSAVGCALGLAVLALDFFGALGAPAAFASAPAAPPPKYDRAIARVSLADLQTVLDRDLVPAKSGYGALAPATHSGVSIGVLQHGDRRVFAYGTASSNSIFEIGSITKTFTGLVLARMVEQGKVGFDQPVRELLPPGTVAKPAGAEITLLDLATQHSGLPSMPDNFHPADASNPYQDYHAANLYDYLGKHGVAKPGSPDFLYSNLGFGLLGQALAVRAGTEYRYLVQEEVTGPLGMNDTVVGLTPEKFERFIQGHNSEHRPVHQWDLDALAGAGALRSTAGDLLTYLDAQLHPEKFPELSSAILQTHQLRASAGSFANSIGLAWFYRTGSGDYWHGGDTAGYSACATFHPQDDYAVVVLSNTGSSIVSEFSEQLCEHIRERLAGQPAVSLANPMITSRAGGWNGLRTFAAYWVTMLGGGVFVFCSMLAVQGLAQLLPRQVFLRISAALQMIFFGLLLTVYFLQPGFSTLDALAANQKMLYWLPSYWFLGLFESLNGTAMPAQLGFLADRARIGIGLALCGAALAYLICYFRTLRKIAEQPDILPGRASLHWLPAFGAAFPTAIVQFSIRTLLRSRQHRVVLSFYLGLAFGLAIFFVKAPVLPQATPERDPWHQLNPEMLAASIVMMGAAVLGARVVFSLPLDLRANWIFRVTPILGGADCIRASRRALYLLAVIPVWAIAAVAFLWLWPWRPAAEHLALLALLGSTVAELCLYSFHKLPFTCSYLPGRSYLHMVVLSIFGLLFLIVKGADLERRALESPVEMGAVLAALGALAVWARRRTEMHAGSAEGTVLFEEAPVPVILGLGLTRDGTSPV